MTNTNNEFQIHDFVPLEEAELQISSHSLQSTSLPSSVSLRQHILQSGLQVFVCHLGWSHWLYMTRLESLCMHRRTASDPQVSEAHTGFQPQITKLPSSCRQKKSYLTVLLHVLLHEQHSSCILIICPESRNVISVIHLENSLPLSIVGHQVVSLAELVIFGHAVPAHVSTTRRKHDVSILDNKNIFCELVCHFICDFLIELNFFLFFSQFIPTIRLMHRL